MTRIRAIKPEFWSSPSLPADPWARLLFIALWNWSDDNGVGTANPRELLGFAFPNDEHLTLVDLRRMLVEITRALDVMFYTVEGRPYYSIGSWEKHQKFDRRSRGKHPGPDKAETWLYQDECEDSTDPRGNPTSTRRDSVAGTGEQRNRGTEEQGNSCEVSSAAVKSDRAPKRATKKGTRINPDFMPSEAVIASMRAERPDVDLEAEHRKFVDYWIAQPGAKGTKLDWSATWRNWIRSARATGNTHHDPTRSGWDGLKSNNRQIGA